MSIPDAADVFSSMLHAVDARDWDAVRRAFAADVRIDYSSLFRGSAATVKATDQVAAWERFFRNFNATQHLTGPIVTTLAADGAVTARTHIRAYHRMAGIPGGDIWMVAGHYEVALRQMTGAWTITGMTLTLLYQEGNLAIPEAARSRAI